MNFNLRYCFTCNLTAFVKIFWSHPTFFLSSGWKNYTWIDSGNVQEAKDNWNQLFVDGEVQKIWSPVTNLWNNIMLGTWNHSETKSVLKIRKLFPSPLMHMNVGWLLKLRWNNFEGKDRTSHRLLDCLRLMSWI